LGYFDVGNLEKIRIKLKDRRVKRDQLEFEPTEIAVRIVARVDRAFRLFEFFQFGFKLIYFGVLFF